MLLYMWVKFFCFYNNWIDGKLFDILFDWFFMYKKIVLKVVVLIFDVIVFYIFKRYL